MATASQRLPLDDVRVLRAFNRNKRSITLDLSADEARDRARSLAREADVVVESIADDPRFATNELRIAHRDELDSLLAERLAGERSATWSTRLAAAGVPQGPVRKIGQVAADPETGRLLHGTNDPLVGTPLPRNGVRRPPPALGEHDAEAAWPR